LINDGSKDGTLAIQRALAARDERVEVPFVFP
jgi:glycosyltransferase involved in cell wall biosynthesis